MRIATRDLVVAALFAAGLPACVTVRAAYSPQPATHAARACSLSRRGTRSVRIFIPLLFCLAAILAVGSVQRARIAGTARAALPARQVFANFKAALLAVDPAALRFSPPTAGAAGGQVRCGAAKASFVPVAVRGGAEDYDTITNREKIPHERAPGFFTEPAESSHVSWDRGKPVAATHPGHLAEDGWSALRPKPSSPACRQFVGAPDAARRPGLPIAARFASVSPLDSVS